MTKVKYVIEFYWIIFFIIFPNTVHAFCPSHQIIDL
jgi:hypothetical protein